MQKENGRLVKHARHYNEENDQLLSHTHQYKKDNDRLKDKLATIEQKVTDMQQMERMIVELQARNKELDKENGHHKLKSTGSMSGRLTHALKMKIEKWKKLEEENGQLIKHARQYMEQKDQLLNQVRHYNEENNQLLSHTDQYKKDNDLLKEKLATVEETAIELQAQKRQLEEENGQHKLKLTGSVAGKLNDTHAMKSKIEDLQAQKKKLEEENGQLKETL